MAPTTPAAPATAVAKRAPRRGNGKLARKVITATALPVVLIALWWFLSAGSTDPFFPSLSSIVSEFQPTWLEDRGTGRRIFVDVLPSIARLLAGYAIAVVLGVALGIAVGISPRLRAFLEPVMEFFRAIPPPVLIPVLMLFLGIRDGMKIWVIALGCLWPILLNAIEGVRGVDDLLRDTSRIYRLRRRTKLVTLLLRGASPQIMAGARQSLSIGIILMVISEMFAANNGLGFSIIQFQRSFAIPQMWTGILLLGLIGVVFSLLFRVVERFILSWYYGLRRVQRGGN